MWSQFSGVPSEIDFEAPLLISTTTVNCQVRQRFWGFADFAKNQFDASLHYRESVKFYQEVLGLEVLVRRFDRTPLTPLCAFQTWSLPTSTYSWAARPQIGDESSSMSRMQMASAPASGERIRARPPSRHVLARAGFPRARSGWSRAFIRPAVAARQLGLGPVLIKLGRGSPRLHRQGRFLPCLKSALKGPYVLVAMLLEFPRQTGA